MKRRSGFTLVELLVVLGLIAALGGIAYPITLSIVGRSREAACVDHLRSLGVSLQIYLQEHGDTMPTLAVARSSKDEEADVLDSILAPYSGGADAFRCPADKKEFDLTGSSYFWNSTQNGLRVSELVFFGIKDRPDKIPLVTDKEAWHPSGVNLLYADLSSSNQTRFGISH
ncbi:MAG: prepilin-type N-terminal cleavage/methylation domain-containing protein [Akkermansiaceae bacterium]|nr:prepilin-type N-terminal cleavage/methylation domain-containing protein [Akkermansiaceae bacterium]